jgi:hypothetical protein
VVVGRDVDFGIARMFQFREAEEMPSAMRPFRDIDEATAWAAGETGE